MAQRTPKHSEPVADVAHVAPQDLAEAPATLDPAQRYEFEGDLSSPAGLAHALAILARDVPRSDWRVTRFDVDGRRRWTAVYEKGAAFEPEQEACDLLIAAADPAEAARLAADNTRLARAVDDLNDEVRRLHEDRREAIADPPYRISGAGEAALVVTALVELHRAHFGATRYDNRFLAAATRLGDELVARAVVLP